MKKALLILIGAFALLLSSSAQAEVNGTFNVTEKWTVVIDYKNFGPNGLTTKKTFTGTASGVVVVNGGHYDLIDKVTAAAGPIPWQQLATALKARTLSQAGETFSISGNIVFAEGTKVTTSPPFIIFQGMALLGFFGVPITVDQSELISSAVAPEHFHAMGPGNAVVGGGDFPNQEVDITVSSLITIAAKPPETVLPVAKVTSPANNAHVTTANTPIMGTATDATGIAQVAVTIENPAATNSFIAVITGSNWSINPTLRPGQNKIRVKAKDNSGNFSAEAVSIVFYDVTDQLTVNVGPGGIVTPNLNTSNLVIGRTYTMTAKPAAGFAFAGWSGGVTSAAATLKFIMLENLVLNAAFTDVTAPTVTVTSHKPNQRVLEPGIILAGTAKDNNQIQRVKVKLNNGSEEDASLVAGTGGVVNWSQPLTLNAGPNKIAVYSVDPVGRHSKTNTMTITYVETAPFNVTIIELGNGKISPNLSGQNLEIEKKYTVTAVPNAGFAFVRWLINGSVSNKAALSFVMKKNMAVAAEFRDSSRPKIVITSPKPNALVTNPAPVVVTGTASDNVGVSKVRYRVNGGEWMDDANGTTAWSTPPLGLPLGKHTVQVYALDAANNPTPTNSVTFTLPSYAGIYMGAYTSSDSGPGVVGVIVRADRSARLIGGTTSFDDGDSFTDSFTIRSDGTFSFGDEGEIVAGKITGTTIAGTHPTGRFSLTRRPDTGAQAAHAGFYHGSGDNGGYFIHNSGVEVEHGLVEALVSADGQVLFRALSEGLEGEPAAGAGKGTISGTTFTANAGGAPIKGTINSDHIITATFKTEDGNGSLSIRREFGTALSLAGIAPDQSGQGLGLLVGEAAGGPPPPPVMMPSLPVTQTIASIEMIDPPIQTAAPPIEAPLIVITEVNGSFTIGFATEAGRSYTVQVSEDLVNWSELVSFTAQTDGYEVDDPTGGDQRFYRVIVR